MELKGLYNGLCIVDVSLWVPEWSRAYATVVARCPSSVPAKDQRVLSPVHHCPGVRELTIENPTSLCRRGHSTTLLGGLGSVSPVRTGMFKLLGGLYRSMAFGSFFRFSIRRKKLSEPATSTPSRRKGFGPLLGLGRRGGVTLFMCDRESEGCR